MNDAPEPREKSLRDKYPIYCAVCREKITDSDYRIVGISLAKFVPNGRPGEVPENVYKHDDCIA